MKILALSNCPLVASQGSGYVTLGFCERLRARGHHVDAFGPDNYEPWQHLRGRAKSYRQALGMLRFCVRRLRRHRYDVVEFWGGESWLTARALSRRSRRPLLVSHSNGLEPHYAEVTQAHNRSTGHHQSSHRWYHLDQSRWMRAAFIKVDGLVTVSRNDAAYALKHTYQHPDRVVAIENSLPDNFLHLPVNFDRRPIIGFCGSWLPNKGTGAMRQAVSTILAERPDARALLVGVGEAFRKEEVFPQVAERVDVVPFAHSKDEMRALYARMSILVAPSIYESFGLAAAEAMACGCALVATRTGFAASLSHGEQAHLLEESAALPLQEALQQLLSDEAGRRAIARGGYEQVQRLRWSTAVETLEDTYERWLREKSSGRRP